jgi:hypothetical protein
MGGKSKTPEQIAQETLGAMGDAVLYGADAAAAPRVIARALQLAIEEEREACALAALSVYDEHLKGNPLAKCISTPGSVLEIAARLIRARGNRA